MRDNQFFMKKKNRHILGGASIVAVLMVCLMVWIFQTGKQEILAETGKKVAANKAVTETAKKGPEENSKKLVEGNDINMDQASSEETYSREQTMTGKTAKANSEYKLVWQDNFNGTSLNMKDWNYEYHEPGWVNAELQKYVDSKDNIYVKDGKLVIQAIKTVENQDEIPKVIEAFKTMQKVEEGLEKVDKYWQEQVNVHYHTGNSDFDNYMRWVSFQPYLPKGQVGAVFDVKYRIGSNAYKGTHKRCCEFCITNNDIMHKGGL